jgi:hypothetical protein
MKRLTIADVRRHNEKVGQYWFSKDTMKFFASKIESTLYQNHTFVSSEKKCFDDDTRVYKIRLRLYLILLVLCMLLGN